MGELDRVIMRIALCDAQRLVSQGYLPDEAAAQATPGAWAEFRQQIFAQLMDDADDDPDPCATDSQSCPVNPPMP